MSDKQTMYVNGTHFLNFVQGVIIDGLRARGWKVLGDSDRPDVLTLRKPNLKYDVFMDWTMPEEESLKNAVSTRVTSDDENKLPENRTISDALLIEFVETTGGVDVL